MIEKKNLEIILKEMPNLPGVYRMLGKSGNILYIGKAKNLKNRVKQYFQNQQHSPRIKLMIKQIEKIEITITRSETEALILENNLIKSLLPKYNILFRDDKSYPYLKISADKYPTISYYRGNLKKPHSYFGPYPNGQAVKESIQILQKVFKIRTCENNVFNNRTRPCLLYQIKRCSAPCIQYIDEYSYQEEVKQAIDFLNGKSFSLLDSLTHKMVLASEKLDFEKAAHIRDQIHALNKIQEHQFIDSDNQKNQNIDIIAQAKENEIIAIHWISIRFGRYVGDKTFYPKNYSFMELHPNECAETFITQHYLGKIKPDIIISNFPIPDIIQKAINIENKKPIIYINQPAGEKKKWLEMAQKNALLAVQQKKSSLTKKSERIIALQELLGFSIKRIECFDISHTFGESTIASCVVYYDLEMQTSDYRRYNITDIKPGDDFAAMEQVLMKRYQKSKENQYPFPDLVIIDGGKGQISSALKVWQSLSLNIPLLGIAKGPERKAGKEELIIPMSDQILHLEHFNPAFHLLQSIRDEAHRFAITGHRNKRDKSRLKSELDDIKGIGPQRKHALLTRFGGIKKIKSASIEDLQLVKGIDLALAEKIYHSLH